VFSNLKRLGPRLAAVGLALLAVLKLKRRRSRTTADAES
jgi:hypothetical protein